MIKTNQKKLINDFESKKMVPNECTHLTLNLLTSISDVEEATIPETRKSFSI